MTSIWGMIFFACLVSFSLAHAQSQTPEESKKTEPVIDVPVNPVTAPPLVQPKPVDAPDDQELEPARVDPKRQKFLSLYIGIPAQEKLPFLPPNAVFKGDYKKVTKLSVNRDLNVLLFEAKKEGIATLTIHDSKGTKLYEFRLDVRKSDLTKVVQEMRALLSDIEGITIKIINNRVVVDGQVLLPRDINRIVSVVAQYGDQLASNLVTLSPIAQRKIALAISNDINNPEITVRAVNDKFILEGVVGDAEEAKRAQTIAQMYVPDMVKQAAEKDGTIVTVKKEFVINLLTIKAGAPPEPKKTIQLVINFVELNKNYQKGFRFQFTPTLEDKSAVSFTNDSRQPGGVISSITGVVSNLLPKLNWAKTHGHARVLQSSSLIVLDGQKGELKNTVRIPYQTVNGEGQATTAFEEVGLVTNITPAVMGSKSDSIRLSLDFSTKSLLGMTDQGPMVSNSAMQTMIIVRSGFSAAVGGMISNATSTDYNKMPKSKGADPLISLYASKAFQRNQSQFIVFVTPIIKASASQGADKIKEKFRLRD